MKKKFFHNSLITIGLFLLLTVLLPPIMAKAAGPDDYRLNTKSIALVKGKSFALKVYNSDNAKVNFKSDDQEIASVTDDGIIIAYKVGATVVTATIKDGVNNPTTLTCDVQVGPQAFSVKITKSRIVIGIKDSSFLNVILKPSNTFEDAKFFSNDPTIASVSPGGRVTANKFGFTNVFAMIDASDINGIRKYDTCSVIAVNPEDVSSIETYFSDHPELDLVAQSDLDNELDKFFSNYNPDATTNTTLVNSLSRDLDNTFHLADLRKIYDSNLAKIQNSSLGVVSGPTN